MEFLADHIRNVAVLGHQGSGKTRLVESLLSITSNETGAKDAKNNANDNEIASSKSLSIVPVFYKDYKINLIDIPGNDDFIFEALGVTRLIKGAILVIDATKGVEVETIKHFNILKKRNIPTFIYLNKMDKDEAQFDEVIEEIQTKLGKKALDFVYPIGKKEHFDGFINVVDLKARKFNGVTCEDDIIYDDKKAKAMELHNAINEQVALSDDSLLDKFFSGVELSHDEIHKSLLKGVLAGEFAPILVGSATKKIGLHTMLDMFIDYLPSPEDLKPYEGIDSSGKEISRKTDDKEPFSGYVFKTMYNSYNGQTSIIKVNSGTLSIGDTILCPNKGTSQTISSLFFVHKDKRIPTDKVHAGDIVGLSKLDNIDTGDTLCDKDHYILYKPVVYPTAVYFLAVKALNKADNEKLGGVLAKIKLEDPCLMIKRNNETKQLLLGGTSETHLAYIIDKIKTNYNIALESETPKIVYRETIKGTGEAEGRYIKQSGGNGFYGVVVMKFEHNSENDDNIFMEDIFGGSVPKNYFPAVEKGFLEATKQGSLAGFPVIGVKATLLDGKYHPVDSNEQAFKMAAIKSFREAYPKCQPTILEPIITMKIHIPQAYVGNIMNDLSNRRAQIMNMEDNDDDSEITALAPEAEIQDYVSKLRTLTQGSGYFNIKFDSYKEVPANLIDNVIKNNRIEINNKE
jgi:elongation factor G